MTNDKATPAPVLAPRHRSLHGHGRTCRANHRPDPADGAQIQLSVTAPGYLAWTETLTPTRSLNLVVRLIEQ